MTTHTAAQPTHHHADRLLSSKQLRTELGVPYSDVHRRRLELAGTFPKRIPISANRVAWLESEVVAWIASRAAARNATAGGVE